MTRKSLKNPVANLSDAPVVTPASIGAEPAISRTGVQAGTVLGYDGTNLAFSATVAPGPTYNLTPQNLKRLRRALGRVTAGTASALIACMGDSTTESVQVGAVASWPVFLSKSLSAAGSPSAVTWVLPKTQAPDPRVVVTTLSTGASGWGGTGTLVYSPSTQNMNGPVQVDTFEIYADNITYTVSVNGSAAVSHTAPLNTTGAEDKYVVSCTRGTANVLTVNVSGGGGFVSALRAYDSTTPVVEIANCGLQGTTSNYWLPNQQVWVGSQFVSLNMKPDCTIIDLGINDADPAYNVSVSTFQSQMTSVVNYMQTGGSDVILKSMAPTQSTFNSGTQYPLEVSYQPALKSLSASSGSPLFDGFARWQSFEISSPFGYYSDARHPAIFGNADLGRGIAAAIRTV